MSETFRLVFAGEVEDGQHPAVVRKRLAAVLKLDDQRMDVLFSGKPVVVKKAADQQTALRYRSAFQKAGARLRVRAADDEPSGAEAASAAASEAQQPPSETPSQAPTAAAPADSAPADGSLGMLPVGADLLRADERADTPDADIDTSHLKVQGAVFAVDEPTPTIAGPNTDHLSVAEVGETLAQPEPEVVAEIDVDFDLAEVGAVLADLEDDVTAAIDVDAVHFDVAEAGADLGDQDTPAPPPAPDTSHITLSDEPADDPNNPQ